MSLIDAILSRKAAVKGGNSKGQLRRGHENPSLTAFLTSRLQKRDPLILSVNVDDSALEHGLLLARHWGYRKMGCR